MASQSSHRARKHQGSLQALTTRIETDPAHHLAGPFMIQTPLGSSTPESTGSPVTKGVNRKTSAFSQGSSQIRALRWVVEPASSLWLLLLPVILYINWEILAPYVAQTLPNPFASFLFISHRLPTSSHGEPLYGKGYSDLVFIAYNIVFFSFVRQYVAINICRPIARYFGIKKEAKIERFGEQGYALVYFAFFGLWGCRIMSHLPTWWYQTAYFWIDYPHWQMTPELKRYYLMQISYWCQQFIVVALRLEKPRKDHWELVAHHIVTLWLVGWSYLMNYTLIGNAVFISMDIPDTFLAFSKLLNYIQCTRAKVVSFGVFVISWTYFRHWLNIVILWSVWSEFELMPEQAKQWVPAEGLWAPNWLRQQMFLGISALQVLNLFWYFLIMRILVRTVTTSETEDDRSDDEDDGEEDELHDKGD